MVLANKTGKTVDVLRPVMPGVWLPGAAALTECGGSSGADSAGSEPKVDSGPAPAAPAQPLQILFAGDAGKTGTDLFRTDGLAAGRGTG